MGKFLLAVAVLALYIYAMLDVMRAPSAEVRVLPKWLWVIVVLFVFLLGPAMWLLIGRPRAEFPPSGGDGGGGSGGRGPGPRGPIAPDDDPEFLKRLDEQSWSVRMERLRRERESGGQPPSGGEGSAPGEPSDHTGP